MIKPNSRELLQDPQVIEEIKRHLWIESEKAGHDIGFENAANDWLVRFSDEWLKYHKPQVLRKPKTVKSSNHRKRKT